MRRIFSKAALTAGTAVAGLALSAAPASASTAVDFSSLSIAEQSAVTELLSVQLPGGTVGGQTFNVRGKSGSPCFGIYVGRVTYDSNGRITKIETATVEFYQPVLSCLI